MHVIEFVIEGFKGIASVCKVKAGKLVQVSGKNEAGKSSLLDGLEWTLTGKVQGKKPKVSPIHRGLKFTRGEVTLKGLRVKRRLSEEGREQLALESPEGATFNQPQGRIYELVKDLAFDPLAFGRLTPAEQRERLLGLIGVDLEEIEARRETVYMRRRDINRDHKTALARVGDPVEGAPEKPVDVERLEADLESCLLKGAENMEARNEARLAEGDAERANEEVERIDREIARLEELLADSREKRLEAADAEEKASERAAKLRKAAGELTDPDPAPLRVTIAEGRRANDRLKEAAERARRQKEADALAAKSERLTETLAEIDAEKEAALAGAEMPVEGLGVSEDGVTFNGEPFEQLATSRRIQICTAIAAAMNPHLNIAIVRDGNDLDADSFAAFAGYCEEHGIQPWIERIVPVGEALVIEEGRVKT